MPGDIVIIFEGDNPDEQLERRTAKALRHIVKQNDQIIGMLHQQQPPPRPRVAAIRLHVERQGETMPVQLKDTEKVTYGYTEEDARGNPVPNSGTATWSVGDDTILGLLDNGDGTATVNAAGPLGSTTVDLSIVVTADDGSEQTFQGSDAVNVVAGDVSQIILTPNAPEAQ